jgi:integrase/recombinase XerC
MNLFGFLRRRVEIPVELPPEPVKKRSVNRTLRHTDWLPQEEAEALLKAAEGRPREYAMLSVFLYAGLRSNELRMLDTTDYIPATKDRPATIEIRFGKGSKERTVPAGQSVAALEYWLDHRSLAPRRSVEAKSEALFRGRQGRLTNRYIRELIKNSGLAGGLGMKVHPHQLRHSFCTHLTMRGVPIEVVQVLAGHASIATTMMYVAVPDQRRFEASTRLNFQSEAA